MPTPEKGEKKQAFISRCIKHLIDKEGKDQDQAVAQCNSIWNQHQKNKGKKKSEAGSIIQSVMSEKDWFMEPDALQKFMTRIHNMDLNSESFNPEMIGLFDDEDEDKKPFAIKNGIAIIDIHGPLIKRASGFFARFFGIVGMVQIGETFQKALVDPDVKGIFLDIDSPGGSVSGTSDLADIVFSARGVKPVLSFADDQMTSAAQWIGGAADFVAVANEPTRIGSVGVVGVHMDVADMAKERGVKITVFSAGRFKKIGNQFEHLSKDGKKYIQSQFDFLHGLFIDAMVRNTGIPINKLDKDLLEAKVFFAQEGISVGLAHKIMNRQQAMDLLSDIADGKTTFEEHRTKIESINLNGGERDMDLETKIKDLETKLEAAQTLIAEMNTNSEVDGLKKQIEDITAEKSALELQLSEIKTATDTMKAENETAVETLTTEIETLKAGVKDNEIFVSAGKAYIDGMKAEIKKISVQVDGENYNETLVDKQLEAFGNDVDMLSQFKVSLETRRASMVKGGDLNPDKVEETDEKKKAEAEAADYTLGRKIVPKGMRVVK
ncbi:MAG: S49 family peptidase [Candidatus Brocadiales bacterium]|nr:S49 family peptidase [Candidatus Brocadiales bacterium]